MYSPSNKSIGTLSPPEKALEKSKHSHVSSVKHPYLVGEAITDSTIKQSGDGGQMRETVNLILKNESSSSKKKRRQDSITKITESSSKANKKEDLGRLLMQVIE